MRYNIYKYKRLVIPIIIFLFALSFYMVGSHYVSEYWKGEVQGEHINASHIVETALWLFFGLIICIAIDIFVWEGIVRRRTGTALPKLLKTTGNAVVFLIIVIFIVALVYKKSITGLLATTGALGLIVGFALKGMLENAFYGIGLNVARIFKTGDIINLPGSYDGLAKVKDVTMQTTFLEDFVGRTITIPNNVICSSIVKNYTLPKTRTFGNCMNITIGLRDLSVEAALRILTAVVTTAEFLVQDPEPIILIEELTTNQVKFDITFYADVRIVSPAMAQHKINMRAVEQLSAAGFAVGVPSPDFDALEKRFMNVLHKYNAYSQLSDEEKNAFYQNAISDKRPLRILQKIDLFSNFNDEEITELYKHINVKYFKAGDVIITQGNTDNMMYILVQGALEVHIQNENNQRVSVAKLQPGRYFGEMSLLVGEPRSATITAITDSMVYEITKDTMSNLFDAHPELIEKISEKMAEIHIINEMKLKEYSALEAKAKRSSLAVAFIKRVKNFFSHHKNKKSPDDLT